MSSPLRLAARLHDRARETFVGRAAELETLRELLSESGPIVVHLSGLTGSGKSTLLSTFANEAHRSGATILAIDCRLVEPTARGFLAELGRLTGENVESLADGIAVLDLVDGPILLSLDHYEHFLLLDTWLRQEFLPAAPERLRMVLASRQAPVSRWSMSPRWHGLFRAVALRPLDRGESLELLEALGLESKQAEAMARAAHGNPLALKLAASAATSDPSLTVKDVAVHEVMQQLTSLFLEDVAESSTRDALRATSVARRVTRSLLRSLGFAESEFGALRDLPFVDSLRDGLRVHEAVRDAVAHTLHAEDPVRHAECRREVWRLFRNEIRTAALGDVWRYTADMLYLVENPVVREAFFPSGHQDLAVEPARPDDAEGIRALVAAHEGPEATETLEAWWRVHPDAFRVARKGEKEIVAFYCMIEGGCPGEAVLQRDPVSRAWCDHLVDDPVPAGGRVLFLRRWLTADEGEAPSPGQAACWLDVKRAYMELRPELRRVYLTVVDLTPYAPVASKLGFRHLETCTAELDGRAYQTAMLDFGPASVDGWITRLVGDELGVGRSSPIDRESRTVVVDGARVELTPLEFGLAVHLEDRPGATVTRDELLDEVWGLTDGSGSSNVVDAVVKTLRRKLGSEADRLETVRGHGYRWRAD